MWIVRLALNRPYTFIVLALLILILSPVMILRTPTDIFPNINIPVIAVAWQYTGLNPEETEGRITSAYERILTTTVDNIEHIESTTLNGQAIVKIFLQPTASLDTANAQVTSVSQTILRFLPPGALPPLIINYSAYFCLTDYSSLSAARRLASFNHQLQRVECTDCATGAYRTRAFGTTVKRSRAKLSATSTRHRSRRRSSFSIRWQTAPGNDRP